MKHYCSTHDRLLCFIVGGQFHIDSCDRINVDEKQGHRSDNVLGAVCVGPQRAAITRRIGHADTQDPSA